MFFGEKHENFRYSQEKSSSSNEKKTNEAQISNITQNNQENLNLFKTLKITNEATTNDEDLKKNLVIPPKISQKQHKNFRISIQSPRKTS